MSPGKKIRIGIVGILPSYYQDKIWRELASLDEVDVTVIYLSDVGLRDDFVDRTLNTPRQWKDRIDVTAYRHVFLPNLGSQDLPGPLFRINPGLLPLMIRQQFDVVLLPGHSTISTMAVALFCLATSTPVIYRGEAVPRHGSLHALAPLKKSLDSALLRRFGVVMYSCTGNRNFFETRDVRASQMVHIPCAVDNDFYQAQFHEWHPRRDEVRAQLSIATHDVVVVSVGQLLPRKRVHEIPEIARLVRTRAPQQRVSWMIIGDGPERARIEAAVDRHSLDNVHLLGYQPQSELARLLSAADIGIVLSDYDPSPKALNEMMNFQLAMVCAEPVGTAFDLVRHDVNGFLFSVGDVRNAADRILCLLEKDRRHRHGRKSREIVDRWSFAADVAAIRAAAHRLA